MIEHYNFCVWIVSRSRTSTGIQHIFSPHFIIIYYLGSLYIQLSSLLVGLFIVLCTYFLFAQLLDRSLKGNVCWCCHTHTSKHKDTAIHPFRNSKQYYEYLFGTFFSIVEIPFHFQNKILQGCTQKTHRTRTPFFCLNISKVVITVPHQTWTEPCDNDVDLLFFHKVKLWQDGPHLLILRHLIWYLRSSITGCQFSFFPQCETVIVHDPFAV